MAGWQDRKTLLAVQLTSYHVSSVSLVYIPWLAWKRFGVKITEPNSYSCQVQPANCWVWAVFRNITTCCFIFTDEELRVTHDSWIPHSLFCCGGAEGRRRRCSESVQPPQLRGGNSRIFQNRTHLFWIFKTDHKLLHSASLKYRGFSLYNSPSDCGQTADTSACLFKLSLVAH